MFHEVPTFDNCFVKPRSGGLLLLRRIAPQERGAMRSSIAPALSPGSAHGVPNAQITPRSAHAPATTRASIPPDLSPSLMPENHTAEPIQSSTLIYNCSTTMPISSDCHPEPNLLDIQQKRTDDDLIPGGGKFNSHESGMSLSPESCGASRIWGFVLVQFSRFVRSGRFTRPFSRPVGHVCVLLENPNVAWR